jgi:rSAM/selenodomain-associated transferase 2
MRQRAMISVVIPTLNSEATLARAMTALVKPLVDGVVRELIIADGGSGDRTLKIAEQAGARIVAADRGRGPQLQAGAKAARGQWLLFLHADTVLAPGWQQEVEAFIETVERRSGRTAAAVFRFVLDDDGWAPRTLERLVNWRTAVIGLPYGDQGLLISRALYDEVGGFRPLALMEDVDLVRRIGRRRIKALRAEAVTSAVRFQEHGYLRRVVRNQVCLLLYYLRVSPDKLATFYAAKTEHDTVPVSHRP